MIYNKHFKTQQYQQHSYLGLYKNIHYKHKCLQHIHINDKYKTLALFYLHANYNQCIISIPINIFFHVIFFVIAYEIEISSKFQHQFSKYIKSQMITCTKDCLSNNLFTPKPKH
jgi:hypothetical protein